MQNKQSIPRAALWMCASMTLFLTMTVAGRAVVPALNVLQVMEMRSISGWIMILPLVFASGGFSAMRTARPWVHLCRNTIHYAGQASWLMALAMIPLAQLMSLEFTSPIWGAFLAVLLLGERMTLRKCAAILLGIIGIIVIVRPGVIEVQTGHLIMLFGAFCFGVNFVTTKMLTRTDGVIVIIFWMLIIQSVIGLVPAIMFWETPEPWMWPWILLVGFTGTFSHLCMARALTYAEATLVMPMDYLRLPLAALIGFLLYNEQIDVYTAVGAALILVGNLFNLRRRAKEPEIATS